MAAAMLMVSGPSEAKMHAGKAGNSSESSQGGYDMTGNSALCCVCKSFKLERCTSKYRFGIRHVLCYVLRCVAAYVHAEIVEAQNRLLCHCHPSHQL
jgi:hypothetical protein